MVVVSPEFMRIGSYKASGKSLWSKMAWVRRSTVRHAPCGARAAPARPAGDAQRQAYGTFFGSSGRDAVLIYSSMNYTEVHTLKGALESRGVRCQIRGEHRASLIPMPYAMLEIWLLDSSQVELARAILAESSPSDSPNWACRKCGESNEGQFTECWKCKTARPLR